MSGGGSDVMIASVGVGSAEKREMGVLAPSWAHDGEWEEAERRKLSAWAGLELALEQAVERQLASNEAEPGREVRKEAKGA